MRYLKLIATAAALALAGAAQAEQARTGVYPAGNAPVAPC